MFGEKIQNHYGFFLNDSDEPKEDSQEAFERAITALFPHLPKQGRIYEIGCGWGNVLAKISTSLNNNVLGITPNKTQFKHIADQDIAVRFGDLESTIPPGYFDVILLLESFSNIKEKIKFLKSLRPFTHKIVMRVNCHNRDFFAPSLIKSKYPIQSSELKKILQDAGWIIKHWNDRRAETLPTIKFWHDRLQNLPKISDRKIEEMKTWCSTVLENPQEWAKNNPLIEVLAITHE